MKMTKAMLAATVACGTMMSASAFAAELQEFNLDAMVVTATRTPVEMFKAKANLSVITKEQLEERNYPDLYAALRDVPGVQTTSYGQAGYLSSNGFRINGSNKVVVLIDGVRANQAAEIFSAGAISNMKNIERVEVLKGSASALYGADAQGGVINIITKKAGSDSNRVFFNTGNYGKQNYGIDVNAKADKLGIHVGANKGKEGNFKSAKGEKIFSDGQSNNWNVGLNYELRENSNISFNYDNFNNRFSYLTPGQTYGGNGKYDSTNARLVWNQEFDENTHNVLSIGSNRKAYVPSFGETSYRSLLIQEQLTKEIGVNTVSLGIDHEDTKINNVTIYDPVTYDPTVLNGDRLKTTAVYLQDQVKITDKWSLTGGVRYTDPNKFDSEVTPSVNLGYEFDENTNMYVGWSKFFNTPQVVQMFHPVYGQSNLKPENGKNYEVGVNHKFSDDLTMSAHYFYRTTTDALAFNWVTKKYYNQSDETKAKGFDVQVSKGFGEHFKANVGYTYLNMPAVGTAASNLDGMLPRSAWNISGDYKNRDLVVGMTGRGIVHRPGQAMTNAKAFPKDTYWVWDLNTSYKVKKNIKLYANVYNVFDQYYAENTDVYWQAMGWGSLGGDYKWWPMPGRSFVVGAELTF